MLRLDCSRMTRALGVLAAVVLLGTSQLAAQTGTIVGRVTDATTAGPVPAAQVFIADLDIGVLSQQNGSYLLVNVPAGTQTVTVQRIGYGEASQTVTVTAGGTANLNFEISETALALDEIVVTGTAGGTQRRAIGNTVTSVDISDVTQDVAVTGIQDMLSGRATGVQFSRLSGNVGAGSPIKIRGAGSFNLDANPLIYVDGVRVNNDSGAGPTIGSAAGGGGDANVLDDFNPEDIESIEIIKGPAAASLYGTEASAGVIQIITKKGQEGAPQFNLSVRQGTNYMQNPSETLGGMFTCPTDPSPGPTDCQAAGDLAPYNMYDEGGRYISEGYFPWEGDNLYQNGHAQSYNLDVRGGVSSVRYFLSANYDDEEGFVWYNTDETFRLRGNMSVLFNEFFSLDLSTGYVQGDTRFAAPTVSDGGIWQDLVWSNGFFLDRITPFSDPASNVRLGGFQEHLPSDVAEVEALRDYSRFTGSAQLQITTPEFDFGGVTFDLTQRIVGGIDKGWDVNSNVFPLEDGIVPDNLTQFTSSWNPVYIPETVDGEMTFSTPSTTNLSFDYSATLTADVADTWTFNSSFGAQYYVRQTETFTNSGQGFASTLSRTINQIAQSNISTSYSFIENKSLGFYLQEEIGWNDRLFVTAAVRFDDNSTFGTEAPAQTYPKFSGTWVVSEESFWNFDAINSLRIRGAWGKAGRQPDALSGFNTFTAVPGPGGSPALRPSAPGNPEVEPEVSTELELGFDMALFNDRVSTEFTYFDRTDKDALLGVAIPSSFGFPGSVDRNLGTIDAWGFEAQLNTRLIENDVFSFDLDLAGDWTDNEIKDLGEFGATRDIAIGYPFPNITSDDVVVSAVFDPAGDRANAFGNNISAMCDAGVRDVDDDQYGYKAGGTPTPCADIANQNILLGRAFARTTFRVAPRLSLLDNSLQIFALAEGQYGREGQANDKEWSHIYNNTQVSRLENDPVWVYGDRISDDTKREIYDADFWKLREVGARYNLPESVIGGLPIERASLAVSARNLWTIWVKQQEIYGARVTDPEYGTPTLGGTGNFWEVPPLTSLNATLRVTF
jgi:TonB-linked SusC/RagA family outer membrane protein